MRTDILEPEEEETTQNLPALQVKDIADAVIYIISSPPRVQIDELIIKALGEMSA